MHKSKYCISKYIHNYTVVNGRRNSICIPSIYVHQCATLTKVVLPPPFFDNSHKSWEKTKHIWQTLDLSWLTKQQKTEYFKLSINATALLHSTVGSL